MLNVDIRKLGTEQRHPKSVNLDQMSALEICTLMNEEDHKVVDAITPSLPQIAKAAELCAEAYKNGGRVIYMGAGSSGRYGVVDAVEIPPTFGVPIGKFVGLMAGGMKALYTYSEDSEDHEDFAEKDLGELKPTNKDVLIATAASGRTPYAIKGLKLAKAAGMKTICLAANKNALMFEYGDINIPYDVGPEVLTGSTRLKPGTAQKMVLNMISTAAMVLCGKTYSNLMVDVILSNQKLVRRATNIVMDATGCSDEVASAKIKECGSAKISIVSILLNCSCEEAKKKLEASNGYVRKAIENK